MKFKLLALACALAALSGTAVEAKSSNGFSEKKAQNVLISKDKSERDYFGAEDTSPKTLTGGAGFIPLTFTQDQVSRGNEIKPNSTSSQFFLKPGTYYVTFTGTFQGTLPTSGDVGMTFQIGFQLGANPPTFINSNSVENKASGYDSFAVSPISKLIRVTKPTTLSIVAQDTRTSTAVTVTTRAITIEKFE